VTPPVPSPPPALPELRPRYDGQSLLNVPASIAAALGAPDRELGPVLTPAVLPPALVDGVSAVILMVVDGLGRWQLEAGLASGDLPTLAGLAGRAAAGADDVALASITSVFPSSTIPALTTLSTGLPPADHGLLGWTVYLEEMGEASELARWGPAAGRGSYRDATRGGHDPVAFLDRPTVYRRLQAAGVASAVVAPAALQGSALSAMLFGGATYVGYRAASSLPVLVEQLLDRREPGTRLHVHAYWEALDGVSHVHGPAGPEHREELATLDFTLGRWLGRRGRRGDVLLLLTADHGHVPTDPVRTVRVDQDRGLMAELLSPPTGERRMLYLHARPGRRKALREHCAERFAGVAEMLDAETAFQQGLFGPGPVSRAARRRAGDLLLLARADYQLVSTFRSPPPPPVFAGNHGSLDPREMVVPLLAVRL
jgi:hypothetical protein